MGTQKRFPWYDSVWLDAYCFARETVSSGYPDRLNEFDEFFQVFQTDPEFQVSKHDNVLAPGRLDELKELIASLASHDLEKQELLSFGRFVVHDHPVFDDIQAELTELASRLAKESLEPSYNFLSLYNNLGYCQPHMDAPYAKWTLDICIEQSAIWPIYFSRPRPWPTDLVDSQSDWQQSILSNPDNQFQAVALEEGEAAFFSGSSQWHYRQRIQQVTENNFCHLLFLHFIPAGTRDMLKPENWAELLAIPELEGLTDHYDNTVFEFSVSSRQ